MASLTPLSKGLIGLAVVGAMASAVWNFALKERVQTAPDSATPAAGTAPAEPSASGSVTPTPPVQPPAPNEAPAAPSGSGDLSPAEHAEQGRRFMEAGDFAQARNHLEQAVQGGDAGAACHLGEMTLKGQGGLKADQDAAAKFFQLAQSRNTICFAPGQ